MVDKSAEACSSQMRLVFAERPSEFVGEVQHVDNKRIPVEYHKHNTPINDAYPVMKKFDHLPFYNFIVSCHRRANMRSKLWDYSQSELQEIANKCNSISDMLEALGYGRNNGSVAKTIKRVVADKDIDISHFNPFARNHQRPTYSLKDILIENSCYTSIDRLKIRLVNEGIMEYKCAWCGNCGEWNGKPLKLQLDHINGKHNDHRIENLRFLCPNCHSQTETFSGRNKTTTS
jgi:5-methylcytosine-specific restriction endonuclease McrA